MALFKRAQVSVLLKEPDSAARIARARRQADATTRGLIERRGCSDERLGETLTRLEHDRVSAVPDRRVYESGWQARKVTRGNGLESR